MAPSPEAARMRRFRQRLLAWADESGRNFPWREEQDPFRVLVAELLLQRSRGTTVASVYVDLTTRWPTPQLLASADVEDIADTMRPLGLIRRAETLKAMAGVVNENGMPTTVAGLEALPGVGPYAARATAAAVFGTRTPVVDGVSSRVYRRVLGLHHERRDIDPELWEAVAKASPRTQVARWNWAVLDLAAAVCMPRVPRCPTCPVADSCSYAAELAGLAKTPQIA